MPLYRAELLAKKPLRYAALIHDVSQVLHLPFDWDDGSYARDRSGYNNHGAIYGATLATGKIGMARSFDGVDDYVDIPDDPSLRVVKGFTVLAWITQESPLQFGAIILKNQFGLDSGLYGFYVNDGGYPFPQVCFTEATVEWPGSTYVGDGLYHHIALTWDRSKVKLYVDGAFDSERDAAYRLRAVTQPLYIGRRYLSEYYHKGIIDEVRIYNRALSLDEIRMLMYRRLV